MPTFAAIQFDRFLEPGASKTTSSTNISDVSRKTTSLPVDDLKSSSRRKDIPPPHPQLRRLNSTSSPATEPPSARPQIHPSLYATPEPTPIPDSSTSSFPPSSPFLINHKRRGPRLLKSLSDQSVAAEAAVALEGGHIRSHSDENVTIEAKIEKFDDELVVNGSNDDGFVAEIEAEKAEVNGDVLVRENCESEDFYDPQESMSFSASADSDDYGGERSARGNTPMGGEFYDAWEELSSDSGLQAHRSLNEVETELREMRLTLLMEIEKRKLSEEALQSMEQLWRMLREKLEAVGLILPENLTALTEDGQADTAPIEEICRQIQLARFVSESVGRGIAKAEAEAVMEAQLEMKNFEIARLTDRLHYYETMNREMSQRNQEAMEIARHERQKKRIRQKWVWGSIIIPAAVTLGGAALAWSLLPSGSGKASSSSECNRAFQPNSDKQ
ncbi:uncharacterized protein LOC110682520 [Chenopodium quinoa]|uniref:Uncharacterized protein n=1 Tax=Chenopodium quinoa TaxID=63459 RepID=A0A803KYH5_CHEQI|nr:uncharacterized protein LOC110682520 [Chenopodium quinoa]